MIESPCIRVCTLDESGHLCIGCFRTLDEIGRWAVMGDPARAHVLELTAQRRRAMGDAVPPLVRGAPSLCESCGAEFACGASDPEQPCWCVRYPAVTPRGPDAACLCPSCLAAAAR